MQKSLALLLFLGLFCTTFAEGRRLQGVVSGLTGGLAQDTGKTVGNTGADAEQLTTGLGETLGTNLQAVGDQTAENSLTANTAAALDGVLAGRRLQGVVSGLTGGLAQDTGKTVGNTGADAEQLTTGLGETLGTNLQAVGDQTAENSLTKNTAAALDNTLQLGRRLQEGVVSGLTNGLAKDTGKTVANTGADATQLTTGLGQTGGDNLQDVGSQTAENSLTKNTAEALDGALAG